jgi:hypothetical protein
MAFTMQKSALRTAAPAKAGRTSRVVPRAAIEWYGESTLLMHLLDAPLRFYACMTATDMAVQRPRTGT